MPEFGSFLKNVKVFFVVTLSQYSVLDKASSLEKLKRYALTWKLTAMKLHFALSSHPVEIETPSKPSPKSILNKSSRQYHFSALTLLSDIVL